MREFSTFVMLEGSLFFLLCLAATGLLILFLRQKRYAFVFLSAILFVSSYFILECISIYCYPVKVGDFAMVLSTWLMSLPRAVIIAASAIHVCAAAFLLQNMIHFERTQITSVSVKEAVDDLPEGICIYEDGGRILMVNHAMEKFCLKVLGEVLISGERLREMVDSGQFAEGYALENIEGHSIVTSKDGFAFSLSETSDVYRKRKVHILKASDITELYRKTLSLNAMQEKLSALNEKLVAHNSEIVALTAQKELFDSRVRLHDEMGADLLTIKKYIKEGGSEAERKNIETRLRRDLDFLLTGQSSMPKDEYDLMIETAKTLGIKVTIKGELPKEDPQKHVTATAIHECFTNTLRHAHGDELRVEVKENAKRYIIEFTNNGEQPKEDVHEGGGLSSLRALAEYYGGSLSMSTDPVFLVKLTLPKEVQNVI